MYDSKLTSKGQITIPKVVRETLSLEVGDRVTFVINENGTVTVEAQTIDLASLMQSVKATRSVSLAEMDNAIRQRAARL
ncbi:MAG: AbrB/MazE/SpoVT family DNA-binding domain-containing protein [Gemmatimonas sp.]